MNEYPRDEFDDVSEHTRREGAHRSFVQLRDPRTGLWALIVCGVLALIVGVLMFTVVKPWASSALSTASESTETTTSGSATGAASSAAGSAAPSSSESAPASTEASGSAPASSEAPSTSASASESTAASSTPASTSAAAADLSTSVGVYNATSVSGLAQKSAATLSNGGYSTVRTNNWGKKASTSTVYYKTSANRAMAEAIAAKLGISSVAQVSNIPAPVSVVLGADQLTR